VNGRQPDRPGSRWNTGKDCPIGISASRSRIRSGIVRAFTGFAAGDGSWRDEFDWQRVEY
jgi:hypothetical protein